MKNTNKFFNSTIKFLEKDYTINPTESEKSVIRDKKTSTTNRSPEMAIIKKDLQIMKTLSITSANLNYSYKSSEEIK